VTDTPKPPGEGEVCVGCGHSIGRHYSDPLNVVRCMVIESGVSHGGVSGMPWSKDCPCANYALPKPPKLKRELLRFDDDY